MCLFLFGCLGKCFIFRKCWPKYKKIKKIFEIGQERIDNEMNIIEMIKVIREVKILLKHQSKNDPHIYSDIIADEQCVIDIDEKKSDDNRSKFLRNLNQIINKQNKDENQNHKISIKDIINNDNTHQY